MSLILAEVSLSFFLLALASSSLDLNSCLFSSMNLLHGLSYLRLLDGRETTFVYGTRYSSAFNISWAPRGDHFLVQEISDLIQGFACNCCVDVVCRFKLLFTLARVLRSQSISDRNFFIDFLSFILIFKTAKDKILEHVADQFCFPSSMCGDQSTPPPLPPRQMGGQTLKFDCQNFKFWLGRLWRLIVKTLNSD